MKLFITNLILVLTLNLSFSQSFTSFPDQDSIETSEERIKLHIDFLQDVAFTKAADIGSGNMKLILSIANQFPDKKYFLEDIDSSVCHKENMLHQIRIMDLNKVQTQNMSIHYGDTSSTLLPSSNFDLVLLTGIIHELDEPHDLFIDIKRILQKGGKILISDPIYKIKPPPHYDCQYPFLTEEEFEGILEKENLTINKDWRQVNLKDGHGRVYDSRIVLCSITENR